ncbi:hypothetical protein [Dysgonomonas sp. Marseille-P4677]|nr:hypothetical protein [Dysgonomonas sp. Marseille-P4677]
MKELNSKDPRIIYFFNSLDRITNKLESLLSIWSSVYSSVYLLIY